MALQSSIGQTCNFSYWPSTRSSTANFLWSGQYSPVGALGSQLKAPSFMWLFDQWSMTEAFVLSCSLQKRQFHSKSAFRPGPSSWIITSVFSRISHSAAECRLTLNESCPRASGSVSHSTSFPCFVKNFFMIYLIDPVLAYIGMGFPYFWNLFIKLALFSVPVVQIICFIIRPIYKAYHSLAQPYASDHFYSHSNTYGQSYFNVHSILFIHAYSQSHVHDQPYDYGQPNSYGQIYAHGQRSAFMLIFNLCLRLTSFSGSTLSLYGSSFSGSTS